MEICKANTTKGNYYYRQKLLLSSDLNKSLNNTLDIRMTLGQVNQVK